MKKPYLLFLQRFDHGFGPEIVPPKSTKSRQNWGPEGRGRNRYLGDGFDCIFRDQVMLCGAHCTGTGALEDTPVSRGDPGGLGEHDQP